jgi:hypothetical protein
MPERLRNDPHIEDALTAADFHRNVVTGQPGEWISRDGIPVDLLVPAGIAPGNPKRRGVDLEPHDRRATRRVTGLEAALVDHDQCEIVALEPGDERRFTIAVAGPAALLVAKLQKITDRQAEGPSRLRLKDSHDIYRLLREIPTGAFVERFTWLFAADVSAGSARTAIEQLEALFGSSQTPGAAMAGENIADVVQQAVVLEVTEAASVLAQELLAALRAL